MKVNARRQPGEFLSQRQDRTLAEMLYLGGMAACSVSLIAAVWLLPRNLGISPQWSVTAVGVLFIAGSAIGIRNAFHRGKSIHKGIIGERLVADALDRLRPQGFEVFHDLPDTTRDGRACNIDHVVVGPSGVFAIETKLCRDAFHGEKISVFPERIRIGPRTLRPDPRPQAMAEAMSVRVRLKESLSVDVYVRAVVVFPLLEGSAWVDRAFENDVWVTVPTALAKRMLRDSERPRLDARQIGAIARVLSTWSQRDLTRHEG